MITTDLVLKVSWDDQAGIEPGWHVEVQRPDEEGPHGQMAYVDDSQKVWFPVDVDRFGRHQRAALLAELATVYPGAEIEAEQ